MLLLFTATAAHAQVVISTTSINEKVKVENPKVKKDRWANPLQKGYRGFVEAGATFVFNEYLTDKGFNLSTIHGYQFNHWLYLGGGVGFEGISHVWCSGIIMTIPVFADVRAYMTGTKVKPFFDVQLGYKISCNSKTDDSYRNFKLGGLHASIGFGIEYKRLSVKLAYNLACIQEKSYSYSKHEPKNKSAFYVGLGVNF